MLFLTKFDSREGKSIYDTKAEHHTSSRVSQTNAFLDVKSRIMEAMV